MSISIRVAAIAALVWSLQAGAVDAPLNCKELSSVIPGLDKAASGLEQNKVIEKGGELDKAFGELVNSLGVITKAEKSDAFSAAVEALSKAWEARDHAAFQRALEQVVANVYRIIGRDCN